MILKFNTSRITSQINPLFDYLQKQKENKKVAKLFEIGATFLLISFFVFFAIKPTFLTISTLIGDIKSKELLKKQLKTKINDVIIAQDLFSQVQEKYFLVESSLPNRPSFYQANSQIIGSSQNNQLFLNRVNYLLGDSNYFSTSISTSSSFLAATSFISDLLQNRRLILVNGFTLSLPKDDQLQKIDISVPLNVYYWPSNEKK